jgi:hypothetical protein
MCDLTRRRRVRIVAPYELESMPESTKVDKTEIESKKGRSYNQDTAAAKGSIASLIFESMPPSANTGIEINSPNRAKPDFLIDM